MPKSIVEMPLYQFCRWKNRKFIGRLRILYFIYFFFRLRKTLGSATEGFISTIRSLNGRITFQTAFQTWLTGINIGLWSGERSALGIVLLEMSMATIFCRNSAKVPLRNAEFPNTVVNEGKNVEDVLRHAI